MQTQTSLRERRGSPAYSINTLDLSRTRYQLERGGLQLEGKQYWDRQRGRDGLVPPPGWTRRTT